MPFLLYVLIEPLALGVCPVRYINDCCVKKFFTAAEIVVIPSGLNHTMWLANRWMKGYIKFDSSPRSF
ncbi:MULTISPECIES: hypothetical protein [Paenibacillus]|uniref:hypothetical protein n=1 Tax=Paenibacillus TaxID=44249 RepID=UPI00117DDACB|nr:hypothetical protein [Paenibacillus borealis]